MSAFAVPIFGRRLMYEPLLKFSALVNNAAVRELVGTRTSIAEGMPELISALAEAPAEIPQQRQGALAPRFFGLVTTRACNLNCAYCGFGASPQSESMNLSLAVSGVDWMAAHAVESGRDTLDVHFFGGEPLSAFEVVEVAVHRARALAAHHKLKPQLEVATNGAYSENRARFVGDYFQTVVLSLDGFEKSHNRHRFSNVGRGSFQVVSRTAHILRESQTKMCLRVCVADDNVDQLPEVAAWFCEEFQPSTIDFEALQPTPESERAGLRPPDPYLFADRYISARRIALEHGVEAVYAASLIDEPRLTFCPVGNDALILHPNGRLSACYLSERDWLSRGLDLSMGELSADGTMKLDPRAIERVRRLVEPQSRCRSCFCRWTCAGGCRVNHTYPGCPETYDDFCIQTRVITACLLLKELDLESLADELLKNRPAMEELALQSDDRLLIGEAINE